MSLILGILFALTFFSSGCNSVDRISPHSSKDKALVGKWKDEKSNRIIEFYEEGTATFAFSIESKYRWLEDGKHLRFEYGTGGAEIYEASLDGDVLTINKTNYKKLK